jgi:hypothetical protein
MQAQKTQSSLAKRVDEDALRKKKKKEKNVIVLGI